MARIWAAKNQIYFFVTYYPRDFNNAQKSIRWAQTKEKGKTSDGLLIREEISHWTAIFDSRWGQTYDWPLENPLEMGGSVGSTLVS